MTRRLPHTLVAACCCLLAASTSASAQTTWVLWSQDTILIEWWWVPKGWPFHWSEVKGQPRPVADFRSLEMCQRSWFDRWADRTKALMDESKKSKKERGDNTTTIDACVPLPIVPTSLNPNGSWQSRASMDANDLYYTLSTIAQTLAGALAVMVAFVVFRLPAIEDVIGAALKRLKEPERKAPYKETAAVLKKRGWAALEELLRKYDDELADETGVQRTFESAYKAWRFRRRAALALYSALATTVLAIGLCFLALPFVSRTVSSQWATPIIVVAVALGLVSLVLYVWLIWRILGRVTR